MLAKNAQDVSACKAGIRNIVGCLQSLRPSNKRGRLSWAQRRSGERAQVLPQTIGLASTETSLNCGMGTRPHWDGAREQLFPLRSQLQQTSAVVVVVCRDLDQATTFERFQGGGQGCPIHRQQRCHRPDCGRLRAVQRHQQRELPIRQTERAQCVVEPPRERSRGALHMKAEARIAD